MSEAIISDRNIYITYQVINGNKTLQSIGDDFDITRERVRQIYYKTIKRMKEFVCETSESEIWHYIMMLGINRQAKSRLLNTLRKANVSKIDDLLNIDPIEFKRIRNVGVDTVINLEQLKHLITKKEL